MARIGLELTPTHVRAVRRDWHGRLITAQVPWNPDTPEEVVDTLRTTLGSASSVRLALSPLLVRVKQIQLPNVAAREQWRAIALQPARYFAESTTEDRLAVAWYARAQLAFAVDAQRLERWQRAFRTLGPITAYLPGPVALSYVRVPDGSYELAALGEHVATATIVEGRLTQARVTSRRQSAGGESLPAQHGLTAEWLTALGAASARSVEDWESLTTAETQRDLRAARVRGFAVELAACVVALIAAFAALDYSRKAYEARLDRVIAAAAIDAEPGLALRRRLAGLDREAQLLRGEARGRVDVVETLAALSELLPRAAVVTRLRMTGDEWQASGRARGGQAAAIVPALESDPRFTDVRMTSASTRFREDSQEFESFSIAFRVRPTD